MLIPAIAFQGNCDEAIKFYKEVFGAQVSNMSYGSEAPIEFGEGEPLPDHFVMYSEVTMLGTTMMMSDGGEKPLSDSGFWMQVSLSTKEEVISVFEKLADGGTVVEAPTPQFWAALNAYVTDRFGLHWNILTNEQVS
ncbi:MAG: VOC family protein [Oscillospiraceae bacterium]|nr:VOC family protein [Oscillospiraceae bacterium]